MQLANKASLVLATLTAFGIAASLPAHAGTVVVGATGNNNIYPFGIEFYKGEYQQVYASSALSGLGNGPFTITSIAFESSAFDDPTTDIFMYSLSTTSAAPNTLSTNYAANLGADAKTYSFSGTFTPLSNNTFDFVLPTDFTYDPSKGNLLLNVNVVSDSSTTDTGFVSGISSDTSRVFNFNGSGTPTADSEGLLTQFTSSPAATIAPEPSSVATVGIVALFAAG